MHYSCNRSLCGSNKKLEQVNCELEKRNKQALVGKTPLLPTTAAPFHFASAATTASGCFPLKVPRRPVSFEAALRKGRIFSRATGESTLLFAKELLRPLPLLLLVLLLVLLPLPL